ncbi:MAG: hypothetical protein JRZ95_00770 [Nitrososphaerota archaeon]|jgi:hypothetical protein|nr:hypothetical protein [Nitrososphaerota archaeon]MDG7053843.1 hypothetical protein [Nitrososphaerota archaeon]
MSRWDNDSFDNERYDLTSDNEEIKLLKKFEDYKKLERIEFEKRKFPQMKNKEKTRDFGRSFHAMAVLQGIIIMGFVSVLMFVEFISSDIKFLILSLASVVLSGEIVFISIYFRKKARLDAQNSSMRFQSETEFERI